LAISRQRAEGRGQCPDTEVSYVIHPSFRATPAKAEGDPESREIANLDADVRRHDDEKTAVFFADFGVRTPGLKSAYCGLEPIDLPDALAARVPGPSLFALPIGCASSKRTNPGGLPRFDRTSSQSPAELTTLIRVPLSICEMTRAPDDGFS